jgi:hypothetical protein
VHTLHGSAPVLENIFPTMHATVDIPALPGSSARPIIAERKHRRPRQSKPPPVLNTEAMATPTTTHTNEKRRYDVSHPSAPLAPLASSTAGCVFHFVSISVRVISASTVRMPSANIAGFGVVYGSMFLLGEAESSVNVWVGFSVIGTWFLLCTPFLIRVLSFVSFSTVPSPSSVRITSRHMVLSGDSRNAFKVAVGVVPFLRSVRYTNR